jgi:hypothetical protein
VRCVELEGEACAELTDEGFGGGGAGGVHEPRRLSEVQGVDAIGEVVSVVGAIGEVEALEAELQTASFTELQVLADAGVDLEVVVTAKGIVGDNVAVSSVQASLRAGSIVVVGVVGVVRGSCVGDDNRH